MQTLKIAVCEDRKADRENLAKIFSQIDSPVAVPEFFETGEALIQKFSAHAYDLLLMDIFMGGMTGIETITEIRKTDPDIPVAFVTTSTEFTLESYQLNALGYILKPYKLEEIQRMMDIAMRMKLNVPSLYVQKDREMLRLPLKSIQYLEQRLHQVRIVHSDGSSILIYGKIADLMKQLDKSQFISSHKSYCVNLEYVRGIDSAMKCFIMKDGSNVPIRRESYAGAKRLYENYLFRAVKKGLNE